MRTFAPKQKSSHQTKSASWKAQGQESFAHNHAVPSILHLQRTIGNHAVQRLLQAKVEENQVEYSTVSSTRFAHDFSRIALFSPSPVQVQPKLAVNTPGDVYEQEADRVADQVMHISEPQLQHSCPYGGGCPECQTRDLDLEVEHLRRDSIQFNGTGGPLFRRLSTTYKCTRQLTRPDRE